ELVRSAVGTLGLIAAVPITTALAAALAHTAQPHTDRPKVGQHKPDQPPPDHTEHEAPDPARLDARPEPKPWVAFYDRRD
ncbi:MAG: hypothetical protein ACRDPW_05240, partial [Mycobacteriales bacterium]